MRGARVVLTGGGGFIGSRLLTALVADGAQVTLVGPSLGKSATTARLVDEGVARFVRCGTTFRDDPLLRETLRSAELLVLLGYLPPTSVDPERRVFEELSLNVSANLELLDLTSDDLRHVLFSSSVSVYGYPNRAVVDESDEGRPRTPYGSAKLACEEALWRVATERRLGLTVLRYATVYGPGETVPRAIPNFIRAALGGTPLSIDGDGLDENDYVFVDDVVDATRAALLRRATGIYNVGTGVGTTTLEVARLVLRLASCDAEIEHRPPRADRPGRARLVCATQRARDGLDFSARWRLADGVQREIAWFRNQPSPLEPRQAALA